MRVVPLWHSYEREDTAEEVKLCGIYSTRALAEAAQARLITQPGFRDRPNGFFVDEYDVDQICWPEGYISADKL